MSDEDMTCLFCGRDGVRAAVIDEVTDLGCDIANVPIYATSCPYCGARGPMALSEDEALDALNRRAERTCRYVRDHMGAAGNWFCKCSECGAEFDERVVDRHFVYCPECGARVVSK